MRELYPLSGIRERDKTRPGYLAAFLTHGVLDEQTQMVRVSPEAFVKIRAECPDNSLKLGTKFSKIATPIARALGLDCVNKKTGQLKPESKCQKRKEDWDKLQNPFTKS